MGEGRRQNVILGATPFSRINPSDFLFWRCGRRGQPSSCITLGDKSYEYNEMCRRIERIEKSRNYSATDTVIGNNAINAWFVVTQRRTCTQVLMLHYAGVKCLICSLIFINCHFLIVSRSTQTWGAMPRPWALSAMRYDAGARHPQIMSYPRLSMLVIFSMSLSWRISCFYTAFC